MPPLETCALHTSLKKAQQRRHILQGLVYAVFDIDEVVRIIRSSKTREEAMERLMTHNFWVSSKHPEYELVLISKGNGKSRPRRYDCRKSG